MHVSVFMGPFARGPRDDRATIDYCLKQAEDAAAAGFAMVTFGEQHFNNYEPYCNPLLIAARLAPVLGDAWFAAGAARKAPAIDVPDGPPVDPYLTGNLPLPSAEGRGPPRSGRGG